MRSKKSFHRNSVFVFSVSAPESNCNETEVAKAATSQNFVISEFLKFLEHTSILGLTHVSKSTTIVAKLFWLLLFILGFSVTVYQSFVLMCDYYRYEVIEKTTRRLDLNITFPAFTICANNPIKWSNSTIVNKILQEIDAKDPTSQEFDSKESIDWNTNEFLLTLSRLSDAERFNAGYTFDDIIVGCLYYSTDCGSYIAHNNLYYGNCYTLNSGFATNNGEKGSPKEVLSVYLQWYKDRMPNTLRDLGLVLIVHPPQTAPVITPETIIPLYPGKWFNIKIAVTDFERLESPYSSKCIPSKSEEKIRQSLYYTKETPYLYTREACTESCLQDLAAEYCNCFTPWIPLVPNTYETDICDHPCLMTPEVRQQSDNCDCRLPCSESIYTTEILVNDHRLSEGIVKDWLDDYIDDVYNGSITMYNLTGFEAQIVNTYIETITEEPTMSMSIALGSIGGSFGLWIGISIMSLGEVVALFCALSTKLVSNVHLSKIFKRQRRN